MALSLVVKERNVFRCRHAGNKWAQGMRNVSQHGFSLQMESVEGPFYEKANISEGLDTWTVAFVN